MSNPDMKNLTRYTREKTSFQGWRVCISRQGLMFTKYFADHAFGGEEGSLAAARQLRDEIINKLKEAPAREVLPIYQERYAKPRKSAGNK
ncbi:MAG TPA: hypothetical protein H9862_04955 [Candidatus Akkermansia intestinigallinarum]|uniref:Uncharacterized protein n=1 Tax=Candidatus Akkermansia intestinigallinarum TaxID=2838431 RepID=A0A9D1VB48_9BACT|nr:hypothetical protein [Candidatus Akkermansia intestinigallinarum]